MTCSFRLLIAILFCIGCSDRSPESSKRPHVLLVILDTVRADRVSSYGYNRPTTVAFDITAKAGVRFENAIAPGAWTYPNHASLFTGVAPWIHGAHERDVQDLEESELDQSNKVTPINQMRQDLPTLAERFSAAGYHTVAVTSNSWLAPDLGLTRGFDEVEVYNNDKYTIGSAIRAIENQRASNQPLFLFVNLNIAHSPYYDAPGDWRLGDSDFLSLDNAPTWVRPYLVGLPLLGVNLDKDPDGDGITGQMRFLRGDLEILPEDLVKLGVLYDAGVHLADYAYGRILVSWNKLAPKGIVTVASDHGESLGERGFIGHQGVVYPEVLHIPMVIAAPGRLPAGKSISTPVLLQ